MKICVLSLPSRRIWLTTTVIKREVRCKSGAIPVAVSVVKKFTLLKIKPLLTREGFQ
jgi:hypothetical protein